MKARKILDQILKDKPLVELQKNPLEEESPIAKPKILLDSPPISPIPIFDPLEMEETPTSYFMLDFEDELFTEYGNTSNHHSKNL
jgi:hypothetical protein